MSATKTQAFVLRTQDYRDTSLLVRFYTRDLGKLNGIVKGVRDARYRYESTLEPFSLNEILFYRRRRGGDLHQVTQVEVTGLFEEIRADLERTAYASYFVDLLDALTEAEEPNPAIFELLNDSLLFVASGASPRRAARIFEVKLLGQLGLEPEVGFCVRCRKPAPERAYFSISGGGLLCADCHGASDPVRRGRVVNGRFMGRQPAPSGPGPVVPVSRGTVHFLECVQRSSVGELLNVKVSQGVGEELERILRRFVDFHLSNKLKSVIFLEKLGLS